MARITYSQRNQVFGPPCQRVSYVVVKAWNLNVVVHPLVRERFLEASLRAIQQSAWIPRRIDSYNCRPIRGRVDYSLHSYGLAWDFFDRPYPEPVDVFGPANAPDEVFRSVFKEFGFFPGADFGGRKDYPHIEWADGLPAPLPATTGTLEPMPDVVPAQSPIVGLVSTPTGQGYWIITRSGEVFGFGDAPYFGRALYTGP